MSKDYGDFPFQANRTLRDIDKAKTTLFDKSENKKSYSPYFYSSSSNVLMVDVARGFTLANSISNSKILVQA